MQFGVEERRSECTETLTHIGSTKMLRIRETCLLLETAPRLSTGCGAIFGRRKPCFFLILRGTSTVPGTHPYRLSLNLAARHAVDWPMDGKLDITSHNGS